MVQPNTTARTTHIGAGFTAEDLQQVQQGTCNTRNKAHETHSVSAVDLTASTLHKYQKIHPSLQGKYQVFHYLFTLSYHDCYRKLFTFI